MWVPFLWKKNYDHGVPMKATARLLIRLVLGFTSHVVADMTHNMAEKKTTETQSIPKG